MKNIVLIFFLVLFFLGCKKEDENTQNSNFWKVKYEVTCSNPDTEVVLVYRDESGGVKQVGPTTGAGVTYVRLPWTYEANFSKDPGLSSNRVLTITVLFAQPYNPIIDKLTVKIYVDGNVVNQTNSAVNGFGIGVTYVLL